MNQDQMPAAFVEQLSSYRSEIDLLDAELVTLLARRFLVTAKVGELKAEYAASAADAAREEAQLKRLVDLSRQQGLPAKATRAIFETVFSLVRESHQDIAVAKRAQPKPGGSAAS